MESIIHSFGHGSSHQHAVVEEEDEDLDDMEDEIMRERISNHNRERAREANNINPPR